MISSRRLVGVIVTALLSAIATACNDAVAPERLNVSLASVPDTLDLGDSVRLQAIATRANAAADTVAPRLTWQTSDPLIATVDSTGLVSSRRLGTVIITARSGINSASRTLVVANPLIVSIAGPDSLKLADSATFSASVVNRNQQTVVDPAIVWSTPDTLLALVSATGKLTPRGYGSIRLVATYATRADTHIVRIPLVEYAPGLIATQVALGWTGTQCILVMSGQAYCSGTDFFGERGDGDNDGPGWTSVLSDARFTRIESGQYGTCAISTDKQLYCWGENGYYHHSPIDSTRRRITSPRPLETDLRFIDLAHTEHAQTCAVSTTNEAYCFGHNDFFQLGHSARIGRVGGLKRVNGNLSLTEVDGNGFETCGVDVAGAVYCWGAATYITGNLSTPSPDPRRIEFGAPLHGLAVGVATACALTSDGTAACWGAGSAQGSFGNGPEAVNRFTPEVVTGGLRFAMLAITKGPDAQYADQVCGITITGDLYCWGGSLGVRERDTTRPVHVAPEVKFRHLSADWPNSRFCAVAVSGEVYCFPQVAAPTSAARTEATPTWRFGLLAH